MARKRKAKVTPNKQAFRKELRRIKSFIKGAEKRGYIFPAFSIPKEPTRVTKKQLEQIKSIKPETLYREALYISRETGEVISGMERRAEERKASAAKGARTRKEKANKGEPPHRAEQILSYIESEIEWYEKTYSDKKRYTAGGKDITWIGLKVRDFYEQQIAQYGRDGVARIAEPHPEIMEYAHDACRDSRAEWAETSLNKFMEVLKGGPLSEEESRQFTEDSDYNEDLDELPF